MSQVQIMAGSVAGMIFALGSVNMLVKAWRTKDLTSYSFGQLVLNNVGNLFYWWYVIGLPLGPIYFMHGFFTAASLLMLVWYSAHRAKLAASPNESPLKSNSNKPAEWTIRNGKGKSRDRGSVSL